MDMDDARREIDEIDRELCRLFERRMDVSDRVGRIKAREGRIIIDPAREKEILARAAACVSEEYAHYNVALYQQILTLSRQRQRDIFLRESGTPSAFELEMSRPLPEKPSPRVMVQGSAGSYASIAARQMYPGCGLQYAPTWDEALELLDAGGADYCVLPVENTSAGSVTEVYDLLLRYRHYIVKACALPVEHCLLGVRGSVLQEVREVYSHPHAFPQCTAFFRNHRGMRQVPVLNTATAAQSVAKWGERSRAAVSSRECAYIYGLSILAESIQDTDVNRTRFISVSRRYELHENAGKISIAFSVPHVTGSLYRVLSRFALNGYNLTEIVSRPLADRPFEYFFYADLSGSLRSPACMSLLGALSEELPDFRFLGNYDED